MQGSPGDSNFKGKYLVASDKKCPIYCENGLTS